MGARRPYGRFRLLVTVMKKETEEKFKSAKRFFTSCTLLSQIKPVGENEMQRFLDHDFFAHTVTCRFLYSVIFELVIKVLYELNKNKPCRSKIHELIKIYDNLNNDTQNFIKRTYNNLKDKVEKEITGQLKQLGREDINIWIGPENWTIY